MAAWIATFVGHPVPPQRGWEYLRRLGFTPRVTQAMLAGQTRGRTLIRVGVE